MILEKNIYPWREGNPDITTSLLTAQKETLYKVSGCKSFALRLFKPKSSLIVTII